MNMEISFVLPLEILLEIFHYVELKDLINLEKTCHYFKNIVRNNTFENIYVNIGIYFFDEMIRFHRFVSFDFTRIAIDNSDLDLITEFLRQKDLEIKRLKICQCHQLSKDYYENLKIKIVLLSCIDPYDRTEHQVSFKIGNFNSVDSKSLTRYKTIDLSFCKEITDDDLKYLSHCVQLDLTGCNQITDAGLKYLSNCIDLRLKYCNQITDNGLKHLSKCRVLNLSYCDKITDNGLKHLTTVVLCLSHCKGITDLGLEYLKTNSLTIPGGLKVLDLSGCSQITSNAISKISDCKFVTNEDITYKVPASGYILRGLIQYNK